MYLDKAEATNIDYICDFLARRGFSERQVAEFKEWTSQNYFFYYFDSDVVELSLVWLHEAFFELDDQFSIQIRERIEQILYSQARYEYRYGENYVRWKGGGIWINFWSQMACYPPLIVPSPQFSRSLDRFNPEQKIVAEKWIHSGFDTKVLGNLRKDNQFLHKLWGVFRDLGLPGYHPMNFLIHSLRSPLELKLTVGHFIDEDRIRSDEWRRRRSEAFKKLHKALVVIES